MEFQKGNQANKGGRTPTNEEREARAMKKLDLMDRLMIYWEMPRAELDAIAEDPKTRVGDLVAIRLAKQGMYGDRDIQAIKLILDRICGPLKQQVELSGHLYDFSNMTREQKLEFLADLRASRTKPG